MHTNHCTVSPAAAHQFTTPYTYYSTPYGHTTSTVPPSTSHWASAVPPTHNNNTTLQVQSTLHQHANILSNMMASTLNMLQGNQDFLLDKLNNITKTLQQTQTTLSKFLQKHALEIPSLATSSNSNSHSNSLPSHLSYTHADHMDQASSMVVTSAKHSTTVDSSYANKKLYPKSTPMTPTIVSQHVIGTTMSNPF
jgi:hypothetical protein